ncbi:hypothetical protein H5410_014835 [Solanum commersonii]|uniref:Uncharacterized protein n=1 Tax=Solanum commersonii TaxID=4109 RepID=A0A9J5ZSD4_SOLCO|nr:hypothetical protein H5410_014835 [Solanum commersonii]
MSTHSLCHQSSGIGFATFLSGKPKTHGWLYCAAEDCSATLVKISNVLPLASSHSRSLGGTVLLAELIGNSPTTPFLAF